MEDKIRIIGYDSDSVWEDKNNKESRTSKQNNLLEIQHRLKTDDRECHVYLIDGTKRYYRIYRELKEFTNYSDVKYLGIGLEPNYSIIAGKPKKKKKQRNHGRVGIQGESSYYKVGMQCCYCNEYLDRKNCTREHFIPKHKGGKIIIPACSECNNEKGGLMPVSYLHLLELLLEDVNLSLVNKYKIETKIKNVKKLIEDYENRE